MQGILHAASSVSAPRGCPHCSLLACMHTVRMHCKGACWASASLLHGGQALGDCTDEQGVCTALTAPRVEAVEGTPPLLGLVMIVKNENATLAATLESVKGESRNKGTETCLCDSPAPACIRLHTSRSCI
jgi:hypothetical protein